jgi:hypothetical protein
MGPWAKKAMAGLAALLLLASPAAAQVPDPYARELARKLSHAEVVLTENGYARAAGPFAGGLDQGRAQRRSIMLRAGQDYRIVGVCDERCRDLDMRLYDPNGQVIAQDVLADDVPVIHIRPGFTGQHTIEVAMTRCSGSPCWYAFNVYSR